MRVIPFQVVNQDGNVVASPRLQVTLAVGGATEHARNMAVVAQAVAREGLTFAPAGHIALAA